MTVGMENLVAEVAKEEKKSPMKRQETIKRSKAEQREKFCDAEVERRRRKVQAGCK